MIFRLILLLLFFTQSAFAVTEGDLSTRFFLEEVSSGKPFNFLGVHSLYSNESLSRYMMVVRNLSGQKTKSLVKVDDFYILELPESESTYSSIALVGFTQKEIEESLNHTSFIKTIWRELSPFPKAYGNDCGPRNPLLNGIDELGDFFTQGSGRAVMNCLGPLLQGAWDSTGGMVMAAGRGIQSLVTNPRGFWRARVQQMRNLENFVRNFETKMRQIGSALVRLPDSVKATLLCSFAGGIGADALLAILTGGAGAVAVIARVDRYLAKVLRLERVLARLGQLGKLENISPAFLSSLVTSRRADQVIDEINTFQRHGMDDIVQGAMSCPI